MGFGVADEDKCEEPGEQNRGNRENQKFPVTAIDPEVIEKTESTQCIDMHRKIGDDIILCGTDWIEPG